MGCPLGHRSSDAGAASRCTWGSRRKRPAAERANQACHVDFDNTHTGAAGRRGEVNAVFGLTANRIPPAGWAGMILWTRDSGGSDGRLVSLFSAATLACAARSL